MKIQKLLLSLVITLMITLSTTTNADVISPKLDINGNGKDNGGVAVGGAVFNIIDATVNVILRDAVDGGNIIIAEQLFNLTSTTSSYNPTFGGTFSGTFTLGGGLLTGNFDNLLVGGLTPLTEFNADLTYTGGSLYIPGTLETGRLEGSFTANDLHAELGAVAAVPVPAAVWLFGSGLLGLVAVARRRA